MSAVQVFWKHSEKKRDCLLHTIFPFLSYCVFYLFGELSGIFNKFEIVVETLSVSKSLKFVAWEKYQNFLIFPIV